MRWFQTSVFVLSVLIASAAAGNERLLKVREGFTIERVAGPPLVDRPIVADFDWAGNLYVADSSGSNAPLKKQLEERPHRIVRLTDSDGDGHYDSRTVFADRMMFPEGTLWHGGSLYVSAPPSIWKLTDTDGDGVADHREEWLHQTLTGCGNDLHGPYAGPDGWIYWCKGAWAEQSHARQEGSPFVTRAAHIFRRRPEGGDVEPVMTGGMDNPVDVTFTAEGERIFTTTFVKNPRAGLRDGLIHAIYGGLYGKQNARIGPQIRTGELMPVLTHLGAAAPCGLTRFRSDAFGEEYQSNLFACLFNMRKVTRHVLVPDGATFRSIDEDFVTSDDVDFHPTDVIEDADGSLLVVDTGGWYKLCCPTSTLHKPDVLGGIYRVRKTAARPLPDPRGLLLDWEKASDAALAKLLGDERVGVRSRAIEELGARSGAAAVLAGGMQTSNGSSSEEVDWRRRAVWTLSRIDSPAARELVRQALGDRDPSVRQAAAHVAGLWKDSLAVEGLTGMLRTHSLHNRRAAAEALGRIGASSAVAPLLATAAEVDLGRVLEHSLIYALIEIGDAEPVRRGLSSSSSGVRRAALIALDQMAGGGLDPTHVTSLLESTDDVLRSAALWIVGQRPEWGDALVGYLSKKLRSVRAEERTEVEDQLASYAKSASVQSLILERLSDQTTSPLQRTTLFGAMSKAGLRQTPPDWLPALSQALSHEDASVVEASIAAMGSLRLSDEFREEWNGRLVEVASRTDLPASLRLAALAAAPQGIGAVPPDLYGFLLKHLKLKHSISMRGNSASALANAKLTPAQLDVLADTLTATGALEVNRLLVAFEQSQDVALGIKVLRTLETSPARGSLRVDLVKRLVETYGPSVEPQAAALYQALEIDPEKQRVRLEELVAKTRGGDVGRGHAVFNSAKAACRECHGMGYLGGDVGPDLSRVGQVRTERDLLEAIVFPNASFVRSYEPVVAVTTAGGIHNGVIRKEDTAGFLLATGARERVRVARSEVLELRPSSVSVMPSGLDQQLSLEELADLVAFLKASK